MDGSTIYWNGRDPDEGESLHVKKVKKVDESVY